MCYRISEIHPLEGMTAAEQTRHTQWTATLLDLSGDPDSYMIVVLSEHGRYDASVTVTECSGGEVPTEMVLTQRDNDKNLPEWERGDILTRIL